MQSSNNPIDEIALWKGIQQGDQRCFEALYNLFYQKLLGYGRKICTNRDIVNDALHDVFIDIWKYRQNLSNTTSVKFYLFGALRRRIIKNEMKDIESTVFDFRDEEVFMKRVLSHEEFLIQGEIVDAKIGSLKKQLHNLSPRQYESLVLRFYEDFSYEEIGAMLKVNEQSARNLVQRGLEQLRTLSKIMSSIFIAAQLFH